jgi:DNA-binding NarL/FixJ family response regulator
VVGAHKVQVAVVDDHPLFRAGLAVAIQREPGFEVVGEAGDGAQARLLARTTVLDVAVLDVLLPKVSGISLAADILDAQPNCRILALSTVDEPVVIAGMLRAGASGYAIKTQSTAEIVEAIRTVLGGVRYLPPHVSPVAIEDQLRADPDRPFERLTPREREIFDLLIRGHSNDEISEQLFIARRTVETHRLRIMNKLSARSIIEMIRLAARNGTLHE